MVSVEQEDFVNGVVHFGEEIAKDIIFYIVTTKDEIESKHIKVPHLS